MTVRTDTVYEDLVRSIEELPPERRADALVELSPDEVVGLMEFLTERLPDDERAQVVAIADQLHTEMRPRDRDALWRFMLTECGLAIPRVAVCEGHCAPFDFVADVYFEEGNADKLAIGNRGSGKTQNMGALHAVNGRTKPGFNAATAGAIENQAKKAYLYFKTVLERVSWKGIVSPAKMQMQKTTFETGGEVEIITGTMSGVNSPHPHLAHLDEIELFRPGVFEEALHMAQSGSGYRAQNVFTTSWKKPKGRVTKIMAEVAEAVKTGNATPYAVYRWCVFETTQRCEASCDACPFANVVKGKWEDGSPRTFEQACKRGSRVDGEGKLKRSEGFVPVEDAVNRFMKLSRRQWESQQESRRPSAEGLQYDNFDEDVNLVHGWDPDPDHGVIDVGIDFGGTNPHAVTFWQHLDVEVEMPDGRRIREGADVAFDEVYIANIGNVEMAKLVNRRIMDWQEIHPGFQVSKFYCDPAAKAARLDLMRLPYYGTDGDPLHTRIKTSARGRVSVEDSVALVYDAIDGTVTTPEGERKPGPTRLYVDADRCPNMVEEFGTYEKGKKESDHAMDSMRYRFWGRHLDGGKGQKSAASPSSAQRPRAQGYGRFDDQENLDAVGLKPAKMIGPGRASKAARVPGLPRAADRKRLPGPS